MPPDDPYVKADDNGDKAAITPAQLQRTLKGLQPVAREIAAELLDRYGKVWGPGVLWTVRAFALSCVRLERLQSAAKVNVAELHREVRVFLRLLEALGLNAGDIEDDEPEDA